MRRPHRGRVRHGEVAGGCPRQVLL